MCQYIHLHMSIDPSNVDLSRVLVGNFQRQKAAYPRADNIMTRQRFRSMAITADAV